MAIPRKKLVDPENACAYHLVSKCTRGMYLCGWDRNTRKQYGHRRRWLVKRARSLAECFAINLLTYAVMSNHFHLIVIFDPKACETWADEEVARRWVDAFPPPKPRSRARGRIAADRIWERRKAERRELLLSDPVRLERARCTLGSMSSFMKHLRICPATYAMTDCLSGCLLCNLCSIEVELLLVRSLAITTNLQLFPVAFPFSGPVSPRAMSCNYATTPTTPCTVCFRRSPLHQHRPLPPTIALPLPLPPIPVSRTRQRPPADAVQALVPMPIATER